VAYLNVLFCISFWRTEETRKNNQSLHWELESDTLRMRFRHVTILATSLVLILEIRKMRPHFMRRTPS
jgi:hypothetical protein